MELVLHRCDLKKKHLCRPRAKVKYRHFNKAARGAIRLAGGAIFWENSSTWPKTIALPRRKR